MGPEILAACKKAGTGPEANENDVTIEAIGAEVETDREVASHTPPGRTGLVFDGAVGYLLP